MIGTWQKAAIGLVLAAAGVVVGGAPAHASVASLAVRQFVGVGAAPHKSQAVILATADAFNEANAAGATDCKVTDTNIDDSDPFQFIADVTVTCQN